jgi:sortase A
MKTRASLITALLVLSASLVVSLGAALLLVGRTAPPVPAGSSITEQPAAATAPPAQSAEQPTSFPLVAGFSAVPRPEQPARIVIASIALDAPVVPVGMTVVNGTPSWETAAFAVGYYNTTALPGTRGNTVMAGHISSPLSHKGDIFRRLPGVRLGDEVAVYVGTRRLVYQVSEIKVVTPYAVQVMAPTSDATLTLLTCYPDGVYNQRLVVVGKLASDPS